MGWKVEVLRVAAALTLTLSGELGAAEAKPSVEALAKQLTATSVEARRDAAYRLNQLGPAAKPALPALITALDDPDKQVWAQAIAAIANLGPAAQDAIPALLEGIDTRRERGRRERDRLQTIIRSAHALSRIGPAAIPKLIPGLQSDDSGVRAGAARALGGMGPAATAAIPALQENLGHREGFVRREVVDALGQIGPAAAAPMIEALTWYEPVQRISAALALGQIGRGAKGAGEAMEKQLARENDSLVRAAILTALPKVSADSGRVLPLLVAGLKSDKDEIRSAATGALLTIRPPSAAISALLPMLKDSNAAHVQRAVSVLGRFGSAVKTATPELVSFAMRQQPPPPALIEVLVQLGGSSAPALVDAFGAQNPDALTREHWLVLCLKTIGEPALPALTGALADARIGARFGAVRTLGEMGLSAKAAVPKLLPLTADADPRVRAMTLGTLAAAKVEAAVLLPKLEAALGDPVPVVRVTALQLIPYLGADGAPLDARVREASKDADSQVRAAARALLDAPK